MRELLSQSLSGIRDIIPGQNYGFIKARLDQLLPKEAASSFAKVEIHGKEGMWYAENNLPYKVYSEASELEKEEIAIELELLKETAFGKLKDEMPYWENLFVVPNQDAFYYLGEIYNHGIGNVDIDYSKALSYFKQSINTDQILPFVVTLIADFYYEGKGTVQNKKKAKNYIRRHRKEVT